MTIKTNSYHFCKLSLVKKPIIQVKHVEPSIQEQHVDCSWDVAAESLGDSSMKMPECQPERSGEVSSPFPLRILKFSL